MCYAKPGPRCSTHAKAALDRAQAGLAAATAGTGSVSEARFLVVVAENDYDATPAGMAELEARMDALVGEYGAEAARERTDYVELELRRQAGQERRRHQMEAYRAIHGDPAPTADHDEAEAAAGPDSTCMCLDYRFKGDCPHVTPPLSAEAEVCRRALLPTGEEACLRLHAANSRLGTLRRERKRWVARLGEFAGDSVEPATVEARTAHVAMERWTQTLAQDNPEFATFLSTWHAAKVEARHAEEAFYGTEAGGFYVGGKSQELVDRAGYVPAEVDQMRERVQAAKEARAQAAAEFTVRTGQPAPVERLTAAPMPPVLMYASGCPDSCRDFAWTGKCAHVDEGSAQQEVARSVVFADREARKEGRAATDAFRREVVGDEAADVLARGSRGRWSRLFGRR